MFVTKAAQTQVNPLSTAELGIQHVDTAKPLDQVEAPSKAKRSFWKPLLKVATAAAAAVLISMQVGCVTMKPGGHYDALPLPTHGVTLTWTMPTTDTSGAPLHDPVGYKIYRYHPTSRSVPGAQPIEVRDVGVLPAIDTGNGDRSVTYRWNGLPRGEVDYWSVSAYIRPGGVMQESALSNEAVGTVR
jgi:hypothetical protein